jgi:hypothetical protein
LKCHQNTKESSLQSRSSAKRRKISSNKEIPKRIPTNLNIKHLRNRRYSIHQSPYCKGGKSAISDWMWRAFMWRGNKSEGEEIIMSVPGVDQLA